MEIHFVVKDSAEGQLDCNRWWTDFTGTLFEGTRIPLAKWFLAIDAFRKGESAKRVAEELRINRNTAMRIRTLLLEDLWLKRLQEKLRGVVEADEVSVTAGEKGQTPPDREPRVRALKQRGRGTWDTDRPPVIGVVSRDSGEIRLEVSKDAKKTCHTVLETHVEPGSTLYTDSWVGYLGLAWLVHAWVCHAAGEYARDDDGDGFCEVHCNTMEGIWSLLRQWLRALRGVRKKFLYRYVYAFEFFYNLKRRVEDSLAETLRIILTPHHRSA